GVGGGVEGDGDVHLGGGDEVDGEAVVLEDAEDVGEEADLLPHGVGVHGDEGDAGAGADGLDLGPVEGGLAGDGGAGQVGEQGAADLQGDVVAAGGRDGAGVEDLGAGGGDLLGLVVLEELEHAGG